MRSASYLSQLTQLLWGEHPNQSAKLLRKFERKSRARWGVGRNGFPTIEIFTYPNTDISIIGRSVRNDLGAALGRVLINRLGVYLKVVN